MKKIYISRAEIIYSFWICLALQLTTLALIAINFTINSFKGFVMVTTISYLFYIGYFVAERIKWKEGLPGKTLYNPLGYFELHIGNENYNNRKIFYKLSAESVLCALEMKKDIIIDTWCIGPEHMQKLFGESVQYKESSPVQKIANYYNKRKYCPMNSNKGKSYRYIINTGKLTNHCIEKLQRFICDTHSKP